MREILFRGKRKDNGEWVYGVPVYLGGQTFIVRNFDYGGTYIDDWVVADTLGQYTGLTDKNGKKIFEGDIIKLYLRDDVTTVGDIRYSEEDCRFKFWEDFEYPYGFDITTPFEVIGNIYDNPELLKEQEL